MSFRKRYSGIVVPHLCEKLSYDPLLTPFSDLTAEQQQSVSFKQAVEQLIPQFNRGDKPFTLEHGDDPSIKGGLVEQMYVDDNGALGLDVMVTEPDVADYIDGGIVGLSMTHEFDPQNPSELTAREVSLVFVPQRPGSYITHAQDMATDQTNEVIDRLGDHTRTMVTVAASGTATKHIIRTTIPTRAKMSLKEKKEEEVKGEPEKKKGEGEEDEGKEEKNPFRAKRANESDAEYQIKRMAHSGTSIPGYIAQDVMGTLSAQEVRLQTIEQERDAARKEADEARKKGLEMKARQIDLIIPLMKRLANQQDLKASDRIAIRASGTAMGWDMATAEPDNPQPVENMMDDTLQSMGKKMQEAAGLGVRQQDPAMAEMKDQMTKLTALVTALGAGKEEKKEGKKKKKAKGKKIEEEEEDDDDEEEEKDDELISDNDGQYLRGPVRVAASGTARRVKQKDVKKSAKDNLRQIRQARQKKATPPPPPAPASAPRKKKVVQEEKEQPEEEEEEEDEEDEDELRSSDDDDEAVDIDDEVWGYADRKELSGENMTEFMNEDVINRRAKPNHNGNKRSKQAPPQVIIPKAAYASYIAKRKEQMPNSRVTVAMSGTASPGIVREAMRTGIAYQSLNSAYLEKKIGLNKMSEYERTVCLNGQEGNAQPNVLAKGTAGGGYHRLYTSVFSMKEAVEDGSLLCAVIGFGLDRRRRRRDDVTPFPRCDFICNLEYDRQHM